MCRWMSPQAGTAPIPRSCFTLFYPSLKQRYHEVSWLAENETANQDIPGHPHQSDQSEVRINQSVPEIYSIIFPYLCNRPPTSGFSWIFRQLGNRTAVMLSPPSPAVVDRSGDKQWSNLSAPCWNAEGWEWSKYIETIWRHFCFLMKALVVRTRLNKWFSLAKLLLSLNVKIFIGTWTFALDLFQLLPPKLT